jgi:hypothetical protein
MQEDLGQPPQALKDRPVLDQRQYHYYTAYQTLSRSRNVSMAGPLSIPMSEILSYCLMFQIDNLTERERILRFVNRLDSTYLEFVAEKQAKK